MKSPAILALFLALAFFTAPATAHVRVDNPNGGEVIQGQSLFTINWVDTINHGPAVTYEIFISTDGGASWQSFVDNIAYQGGSSSFSWLVPDIDSASTRIKVTMHVNAATTYSDTSNSNFIIEASYESYGAGTPVGGVQPMLEMHNVPIAGQQIVVHLSQAEVGARAHVIAGTGRTSIQNHGVTILTRPTLRHVIRNVDNNGELILPAFLPPQLAGRTIDVQVIIESSPGFSATAGVEFLVLP